MLCLFLLVFIGKAQKWNLLPDTLGFCTGDSALLEIKQPLDNASSIQWSTPYNIITNTKKIKAFKPGKYFVKVSSSYQQNIIMDSVYVRVYNRPKKLLRDTFVCRDKPVVIDCKQNGFKYFWSTGQSTQKITVNNSGLYRVRISNGGCSVYDSIQVKTIAEGVVSVQNEYSFCMNEENKVIAVKTGPKTKIVWNTGETSPSIAITREGTYWVKTQSNRCGERTDSVKVKLKVCECEMMIPNSFTPNEDNRNDYFFPVLQCDYTYYNLTISDRWGNTVFTTNQVNGKWDGRFKGNLCSEDIYIYHIESTEKGSDKKQVRTGRISLFR